MSRLFALLLLCLAVPLPPRLRVLYTEALGWLYQAGYWAIFRLARFILRHLRD